MCDSASRPAFIPVPDTARIRMVYTFEGNTYMNVFYFHKAGMVASDLSGIVDETLIAWDTSIKPFIPNTVSLAYIEGTMLNSESDSQVTLPVNTVGTNPSPALPFSNTLVIKFSSGLTGRSQRGRLYHIGLNETQVTGNTVGTTDGNNLRSSYSDFFSAIGTATTSEHVIVSYCNAGAWRTTGEATPVLFYLLTDYNVDSQRRRLAGRGR